ncbi:MAG TPA: DUF4056 domain-containing protein [Myxococcales bacterium]|jgi:hypothetical protein
MRPFPPALGLLGSLALAGCAGLNWSAGPGMLAPDQDVAAALGESAAAVEKFDPASLPDIGQPTATRPCCGFGMDLQIAIGGARVLGYSIPNIQAVEDLGRHEYDNGVLTFDLDLEHFATLEKDGLVYTCRGGFVDTGHVRDYADLTLFLALRFAAALPGPATFTLPGDGAVRRVRLAAIPAEALAGADRWEWAVRLAQYAVFHLSVFHELVTWYGHRTSPAWSEKASAFSPEDLYSNLLGIRIAGGIIGKQGVRSRRDWNASMDAWLPRALKRLRPLPRDLGRRAMKDVDGSWWDSSKALPDVLAVPRRNYSVANPLLPWRVEDAGVDSIIEAACAGTRALPLAVPASLAEGFPLARFVTLDFELGDWAPKDFPFSDARTRRVGLEEFPRLLRAARDDAEGVFGAGFDRPGGRVVRPAPLAVKR